MLLRVSKINRVFGLVSLLAALFFISGCFEIEMQTTINPNGSGRRVMSVIVDKEVAKQINLSSAKSALPKGVQLRTKNKGSKTYIQAVMDFDSPSSLNKQLASLGKKKQQLTNPSKISLIKKDYLVVVYYSYEERFTKPENSKLADPFQSGNVDPRMLIKGSSVTYKLTLPGKIDKTNSNAQTYSSDNTAIWNLPLTGNSEIKAQARLVRFWLLFALGIIAFAVFLFIVAIIGSYIYKRAKG